MLAEKQQLRQDCKAAVSLSSHRSAGLGRTRLFHPWGREPEGGWSGSDVFVSHVVRPRLSWTQVSHLSCLIAMGFDNGTVTFRIDHTPLHRIAVQFEWAELFAELQEN